MFITIKSTKFDPALPSGKFTKATSGLNPKQTSIPTQPPAATIEYTNPEPTIWFMLRHIRNIGRNIALQYRVSITLHIENAVKYAPSGSPFTWQGWRLLSGSTSQPRTGVQLWNPSITGNNRRLIIISCLHWFQPRPMAVIVVSRININ